jgi:hypothetical protein
MSEAAAARRPWLLPLSIFTMAVWLGLIVWGTYRGITLGRWPWGYIILGVAWIVLGARYATLELRKPKP